MPQHLDHLRTGAGFGGAFLLFDVDQRGDVLPVGDAHAVDPPAAAFVAQMGGGGIGQRRRHGQDTVVGREQAARGAVERARGVASIASSGVGAASSNRRRTSPSASSVRAGSGRYNVARARHQPPVERGEPQRNQRCASAQAQVPCCQASAATMPATTSPRLRAIGEGPRLETISAPSADTARRG